MTNLYYNRARWYDPAAGRFISADPIGFAAGDTNLYRYCFNNPTNATDPSGNVIFTAGVVAGIAIGSLITANVAYRTETAYYDLALEAGAQNDWAAFNDYTTSARYAGAVGNIAVTTAIAAPVGFAAGATIGAGGLKWPILIRLYPRENKKGECVLGTCFSFIGGSKGGPTVSLRPSVSSPMYKAIATYGQHLPVVAPCPLCMPPG